MGTQKGSASGVVIGVIALVVVVLVVMGVYAYKNPAEVATGGNGEQTQIVYVATTTTNYVSTTTTQYITPSTAPKSASVAYSSSRGTASRNTARASGYRSSGTGSYTGAAYHNASFGLTVPGIYSASAGVDTYAGVSDTASLHFYTGGVPAFQINVWSKEQWNNIRIQETVNNKEGTGPTYFGEGSYLGENFTWIYSIIPGAYSAPSNVTFY